MSPLNVKHKTVMSLLNVKHKKACVHLTKFIVFQVYTCCWCPNLQCSLFASDREYIVPTVHVCTIELQNAKNLFELQAGCCF